MFVLPAIALPFLLMLAVYRLLHIPRQLRAGALQVPVRRRAMLLAATATAAAYLALMAYTVALLVALVHTLLFAADSLSAYLELAAYALAYPLVYLAAAWILYHGLKPVPPHKPTHPSSTEHP
jgi:ABC-type nickel/cobalt efflux system permease component RcnA